jgi:hypothetical protein
MNSVSGVDRGGCTMGEQPAGTGSAVPDGSLEDLARGFSRRFADPAARSAERLSDETLQNLMAAVIHAYVQRVESRETDEVLPPFRAESVVTATEVVVLVTELMKAADVEIFELGMWKGFGKI